MKKREKKEGLIVFVPFVYVILSILLCFMISKNGEYPTGSDTMYHIYRGNYIYQSIKEHNPFPLLNPAWYNGVELMRYWAPVSAYFLAFCQLCAGGDPLDGYLIFVSLVFLAGAFSWLYIGKKVNRPWLGAFLGVLWFFMPNNLLALFTEGNLARSVIMIFLPLFVHFCYQYCIRGGRKNLCMNVILFACMTLCHVGYAGMIALSVLVFLCMLRLMIPGKRKECVNVIVSMLLGFGVTGFYLVPSLIGGITSMDTSENMKNFFQTILITLNPVDRIQNGYIHFYFGLAACIIGILGVLLSKRICIPGFLSALFILVCTTTAMYQVLRFLPGSQYLWMLRFISIALCFILYSMLLWTELRKVWLLLFCIMLVADTLPSLRQIYGNQTGQLVEERFDEVAKGTLIQKAQEITKQRFALIDASRLGSMGAYLSSAWGNPVDITFGAGWEAAETKMTISRMNKAAETGQYLYLFDRAMELGNDTVLVCMNVLDEEKRDRELVDEAALKIGYELAEGNDRYRLYHMETPEQWGTVSAYEGIAIGTGAGQISLTFPSIKEEDNAYIDEFSFDELKNYKILFLDGFAYHNKEAAEQLVTDLSHAGVRVVILADGIPEYRRTHSQTFLGVNCNYIEFTNGFPILNTKDGVIYADLFPEEYEHWKTVYLDGLDEVWGYSVDNDFEIPFYGTVDNENLVFIGFDLTKFFGLTLDKNVEKLLSYAFLLSDDKIPHREIVPLEITYEKDQITIHSETDSCNTSIAYHDIFRSESPIYREHNLTVVDKGTTEIRLKRPYFYTGVFISDLFVVLSILYIHFCGIEHKKSRTSS